MIPYHPATIGPITATLIVAGFRVRIGRIAAMFMNGDPAKTGAAVRADRRARSAG